MNGYQYNVGYDENGLEPGDQSFYVDDNMMMRQDGGNLPGAQSLDDIVNQNTEAIRRQSMPQQQYGQGENGGDSDLRQMPMMDYNGSSPAGAMGNYGFDGRIGQNNGMMAGASPAHLSQRGSHSRRESESNLGLNTNFTSQSYDPMMQSNSSYTSPAHPSNMIDMGMNNQFMDSSMSLPMDYMDPALTSMSSDTMNMNAYSAPQFTNTMATSPMHIPPRPNQEHRASTSGSSGNVNAQFGSHGSGSGASTVRGLSRNRSIHMSDKGSPINGGTPTSQPKTTTAQLQQQMQQPTQPPGPNSGFQGQPQNPEPGSHQDRGMYHRQSVDNSSQIDPANFNPNNQGFDWKQPEGGWPSTMVGRPHMHSVYKNAYSSTGFDMVGVLMRVATRPNPEISIGSVDLSCAFVVCDAEKDDFPIVYCSDNFERLTGYTKHMILGRNCRFLQSPDGNVAPGVRRKYVDDDSVLYLKNMINARREAQMSLINYRRGGQPFMNLLTMIPITWDTEQVKFFVGFQVDLVEQPNAVTNKNPGMSSAMLYARKKLTAYNRRLILYQLSARDDDATICHECPWHITAYRPRPDRDSR